MAETSDAALDPRITPARPDLAAMHLAGKVAAARFVEGRAYEVVEPQAPVRRAPSPEAPLDTEALKGEPVIIYDMNEEGWAWGQLETDGYVGFMPASALREPGRAPSHKVIALRTLVFPGPSIMLPPLESLSFGCRLAIARTEGPLAVTASGGYVPVRHLASMEATETDFVAVAERFLGTPYLWGGKTNLGLDCSGLVQIALTACGIACPRDSDMQEKALGEPLAPATPISKLRRGDLIFWQGHVAIVRDEAMLLHANAFHMAVAIEPIAEAIARIRAAGGDITGVRRIAPST
jgi:cell wall-associated NlpC family hydrolase